VENVDAIVVGWRPRQIGGVTLLLAEATPAGLVYVGRCPAPASVVRPLERIAAREPPLWMPVRPVGVHWVRPELHVEVTAAARAPDGRLRDPVFRRACPDRD
jgi:hypothetical protein